MECKRLFIGGLYPEVKDEDLQERFSRYGQINSIEIKRRRDSDEKPSKTFAYIDMMATEADVKKCISTFNNMTWKNQKIQLQFAKENFLNRLEKERQQEKENPSLQLGEKDKSKKADTACLVNPLEALPGIDSFHMKGAPPGPIPGQENWVVGKYGRVLPVVNLKKKGSRKVQRVDPSKLTHNIKKVADQEADEQMEISDLTWEMTTPDSDMTKKRKGQFPAWKSPPRKKKPAPTLSRNVESDKVVNIVNVSNDDFEVMPVSSPVKSSGNIPVYVKQNNDKQALIKGRSPMMAAKDSDLSRFDSDTDSESENLCEEVKSGVKRKVTNSQKKNETFKKKGKTSDTPEGSSKGKVNRKQKSKVGKDFSPSLPKPKGSVGETKSLLACNIMDEYYSGISLTQSETGECEVKHGQSDDDDDDDDNDDYSDFESLVKAEEEKLKKLRAKNVSNSVLASVRQSEEVEHSKTNKTSPKKDAVKKQVGFKELSERNQDTFEVVSRNSKELISDSRTKTKPDDIGDKSNNMNNKASVEPSGNNLSSHIGDLRGHLNSESDSESESTDLESSSKHEDESDGLDSSSDEEESVKDSKTKTKPEVPEGVRGQSDKMNNKASVKASGKTSHVEGFRPQLKSGDCSQQNSQGVSESSESKNLQTSSDDDVESSSEEECSQSKQVVPVGTGVVSSTESNGGKTVRTREETSKNVKKQTNSFPVLTNLRPKSESEDSSEVESYDDAHKTTTREREESSESESEKDESDFSEEKQSEEDLKESSSSNVRGLYRNMKEEDDIDSNDCDSDLEMTTKNKGKETKDSVALEISDVKHSSSESDSDFENLISKEMGKINPPQKERENMVTSQKKRKKTKDIKAASRAANSNLTLVEKLGKLKSKDNQENVHRSDSSDSDQEDFKPVNTIAVLAKHSEKVTGFFNTNDEEIKKKTEEREIVNEKTEEKKLVNKKTEEREVVNKKTEERKMVIRDEYTEEDRQETERKRMEAVKQRQRDHSAKQNTIRAALASLDARAKPNKKVVFDSDSDAEPTLVKTASSKNTDKITSKTVKEPQNTKKASTLFDSSSDSEEETNKSRFDIRPEFEGTGGRKLMKLQSRFGNDERFKLTANFAESDSDSDDSDGNLSEDEKTKSLKILQSVVNTDFTKLVDKTAKIKKKFKDVSQLKYDPSKKEHSQFEIQSTPKEHTETKKKKKKKKDKQTEPEPEALPEVSKDKYYEVSETVLNTFAKKENKPAGQGFSLLAAFGKKTSDDEEVDMDVEEPVAIPLPQVLMADQTSIESRFMVADKGDNSKKKKKGDKPGMVQKDTTAVVESENVEKENPEKSVTEKKERSFSSSFFFTRDDSRLKEGEKFYRQEEDETITREWNQKRRDLIQNYKSKQKVMKRRLNGSGGGKESFRGGARGGRGGARGGRGGARGRGRGGARGRGRGRMS